MQQKYFCSVRIQVRVHTVDSASYSRHEPTRKQKESSEQQLEKSNHENSILQPLFTIPLVQCIVSTGDTSIWSISRSVQRDLSIRGHSSGSAELYARSSLQSHLSSLSGTDDVLWRRLCEQWSHSWHANGH